MSATERGYPVVIPARNESASIADIAARALRVAATVIVVDDGSTDGTHERLAGLPVVLLRNDRNRGKGASLWRGMQHALTLGADGVVTLDGDGQHMPEDVPRLVRVARAHPADLVVGARLVGRASAPRARRAANRVADFFVGWAAGQPLDDSQSGFRVYPAALLRRLAPKHDARRGFVFESEVLIAAAGLGAQVRSVAIASVYPANARPSHFRPVRDIAYISRMVAWQLLRRGLHPAGLWRSLAGRSADDAVAAEEPVNPAR